MLNIFKFIIRDILFSCIYKPIRWFEKNILSQIAFLIKFSRYSIDPLITKDIEFHELKAKVNIRTYFDHWRIDDYEKHPVKTLLETVKSSGKKSNKINYYEIGANVGYSTIMIGKLLQEIGEVVAFEVEATNFKALVDNIQLNKLNNVTPLQIGVADHSSVKKFYFNRYHDPSILTSSGMGMHSLKFNEKVHMKTSFQRVPLMSLEKIINEFSLPFPTHVFIDAYGAEDIVIKGMKEILKDHRLKVIMIDIENAELDHSYANKTVIGAGFKLTDCIIEEGFNQAPKSFKTVYTRKLK